ncbi:MAG TPA: ATP-dependent Clp protease ATP-binding subunit [Ktedonobacteraceae bacterium]|nr:ATP-dependent Clp protease ATP-binding subunit [Ktedonobacteraceae bacterium]
MGRVNRYTQEARQALSNAHEEAQRLRHRTISTEHLLLGILRLNDAIIEAVFTSCHASSTRVCQALEFVVGRGNKALLSDPALGASVRMALTYAEQEAAQMQAELIGVEHLFLALFCERDGVASGVLESFGLFLNPVRQQIVTLLSTGREHVSSSNQYQARYEATPTLNLVSRDLTAAALAGMLDPMIGREVELERTMQILTRRAKNNPVLIGHAGVGKTAIAEGLALRIVQGQVPESLLGRRVVALDVGLLTVGTKFRGDFEERLKRIMQEIIAAKGIIVVIDELHTLVGTGVAEGSIDAANLFKPMLARGEFQCIGATTLDDYRKTIEADPALERRFQPVQVPETTPQETLAVLQGLRPHYADFHAVTITDEALHAAVRMSSRYIQERYQPDKALDLIDEAAARVCVRRTVAPSRVRKLRDDIVMMQKAKDYAIAQRDFALASKRRTRELQLCQELHTLEQEWATTREEQRPVVGEQQIAEVVAMWTGIPVTQIAAEEAERLLKLEDELHRRLIGQDMAVQAVAKAVRRSRTNLRDSRRPIGSFIFVGPTGVGKTELARVLAASLFGDENALIKLDMSEFMESHSAARLVGAPPGYVGYDQAGQLTEAVHRRPYSVVLFDEIEKAHPHVFDLLLQILDDGCLTDSHGHTVSFKHTLIVITSNAGTAQLERRAIHFTSRRESEQERQIGEYERIRSHVMLALKDLFKPELLNRIDEIVPFHSLTPEHLHQIVHLMVEQTQKRMAEQSFDLQVTTSARSLLVAHGYDPVYGARPLRRTIQRMLEDMLAESILQGTCSPGDTIMVDVVEGKLAMQVLTPLPVQTAGLAIKGEGRQDAA